MHWIDQRIHAADTFRTVEYEITNAIEPPLNTQPFTNSLRISMITYYMKHYGYVFQVKSTYKEALVCDMIRPKRKSIRATEQDYVEMLEAGLLQLTGMSKDRDTTIFFYQLSPAGLDFADKKREVFISGSGSPEEPSKIEEKMWRKP